MVRKKTAAKKPKRQRRITPFLKERAKEIYAVVSKYKLSKNSALYLAKSCLTAEKIVARIETMKIAEIPMTGLVFKLSQSELDFKKLVERYEKRRGLTVKQGAIVAFLFRRRVSKRVIRQVALRLKRSSRLTLAHMKARVAFFEGFELDPNRYGVSRIPVPDYEKHLAGNMPFGPFTNKNATNTGVERILRRLENRHAAKKLGQLFPEWRSFKMLTQAVSTNKLGEATILARFNAARARGIRKPTPTLLARHSVGAIKAGTARMVSSGPTLNEIRKAKSTAAA